MYIDFNFRLFQIFLGGLLLFYSKKKKVGAFVAKPMLKRYFF